MRQIIKILVALGIIAFAVTITAVSCGKTAGGGGNNNNNNTANTNTNSNSGGNGGSGDDDNKPLVPTTNLVFTNKTAAAFVKLTSNTVTVNAADLAGAVTPYSDANADNRGFDDVYGSTASQQIFNIVYPGASSILLFVNRASISTNSITMPATVATCPSSETTESANAIAGNGNCRTYTAGGDVITFDNYLGTVFNNTKTTSHARGIMYCGAEIAFNNNVSGGRDPISDTTPFNQFGEGPCYIAVVNSAGTAAAAEIDDAWVGDTASTTEVDLHAIAINVSDKTIPQLSSETGYGLTRFTAAHDNAAFKRLLQNNPWGELKFKVKIVKSTDF